MRASGKPLPSIRHAGKADRGAPLLSAAATLNITVSSEAEVCGGILRGLGVAASELLLETKSMNTYQNAQFSRALLEQLHPDRIALVTSGFHIRRSLLYFAHFGIDASGIRADFRRPISLIKPCISLSLDDFPDSHPFCAKSYGTDPSRQYPLCALSVGLCAS